MVESLKFSREFILVSPALTHVDYSARIQNVYESTSRKYRQLISRFNELRGCPVIVNTSFNARDEPIINMLEDSFHCLMEFRAVTNCILRKEGQNLALASDHKNAYELDSNISV